MVFAWVVGGEISRGKSGPIISTTTTTWNATESACTRVNCVFFDQISGTATGLLDTFKGGSLGGEIMSRRFCQNPPNPAFQLTSRSERTAPRGAARKNSFKLSVRLSPKLGIRKAVCWPGRNFAGRSTRKSRRLEKRLLIGDTWMSEGSRPIRSVGSLVERPILSSCEVTSDIESAYNLLPQVSINLDAT